MFSKLLSLFDWNLLLFFSSKNQNTCGIRMQALKRLTLSANTAIYCSGSSAIISMLKGRMMRMFLCIT